MEGANRFFGLDYRALRGAEPHVALQGRHV